MLDILSDIENWLKTDRKVALATVVETWGSSPRRAGAKMGISDQTGMTGSVSGGCVETAVVEAALEALGDHKPRLLNYGVSDDTAWDVGLSCGGKIAIFVEPLDLVWWQTAAACVRQNMPFTTVLVLNGTFAGQKIILNQSGVQYSDTSPELRDKLAQAVQHCQETARLQVDDLDVMVDMYRLTPRLVIVGGAHAAVALKNMARLLGFRVIVIDPRRAFATQERFSDVEMISHQYPDKILPQIGLTADTYIAVLTHDPKIDDAALRTALPSPAAYIGILSSKRTHEKRLERLTAAGVDTQLFDRIHTPIGMEIGARTPEEIALCIMAEIIAVRNGVRV